MRACSSIPVPVKHVLPQTLQDSPRRLNFRETAQKLSRQIYRHDLYRSYLVKLERSVLRQETTENLKMPRLRPKLVRSRDRLKPGLGEVEILSLPKLPFGMHKSYNADPGFVRRHFAPRNPQKIDKSAKHRPHGDASFLRPKILSEIGRAHV